MTPVVRLSWTAWADQQIALPAYATAGAAGADLRANLAADDRSGGLRIRPIQRLLVPTGLHLELPEGFEAQVRPRSGLALKHGITLANAPGTIDCDYRGELGVILINLGAGDFIITHGERIAQLVVAPVVQARLELVHTLAKTARGAGGFGSTGRD